MLTGTSPRPLSRLHCGNLSMKTTWWEVWHAASRPKAGARESSWCRRSYAKSALRWSRFARRRRRQWWLSLGGQQRRTPPADYISFTLLCSLWQSEHCAAFEGEDEVVQGWIQRTRARLCLTGCYRLC